MNGQQINVIIRQRGQFTLPDAIREKINWLTPGSVVTINAEANKNKVVLSPYSARKTLDWDKLWKDLKRVRAYRGKGGGNLSAFIDEDRQTRR